MVEVVKKLELEHAKFLKLNLRYFSYQLFDVGQDPHLLLTKAEISYHPHRMIRGVIEII